MTGIASSLEVNPMDLRRHRVSSLMFVIAIIAVASCAFVMMRKSDNYKKIAGNYKMYAEMYEHSGTVQDEIAQCEWEFALRIVSDFVELESQDDFERVARGSSYGQMAQNALLEAKWNHSMATWSERMEAIYRRLAERPWEAPPQRPIAPRRPVLFDR